MNRPWLPLGVALIVAAAACVLRYYTVGATRWVVPRSGLTGYPDAEVFFAGTLLPILLAGAGVAMILKQKPPE